MSVILCTAGYDHTIRFWEALSGICSRTIQHSDSQVNRLCITPDKKFLAAAGRHVVRMYDIKSSNPNPVVTFEGHTNNITGVAFHCEGKWMVTSSEDMTVKVWDTRSGIIQRNYQHTHPVNDVVIHPNQGELVSADRGGNIRIWDLGESKCTHQLIPVEDVSMSSISVASDGSLLVAGNNLGDVYIWRMFQSQDSTSLAPCRIFRAHKNYLTRLLLSPDVKLLATCSADHTVRIWSIDPTEDHLQNPADLADLIPRPPINTTQPSDHTDSADEDSDENDNDTSSVPSTSNTSDHSLVTPDHTETETETDAETSNALSLSIIQSRRPLPLMTVLETHQRWVWDCAFSADSAYLVTVCSDHYARLWDVASAKIIRQYNGHHRGAVCVALNDYSDPR